MAFIRLKPKKHVFPEKKTLKNRFSVYLAPFQKSRIVE